MRAFCCVAKAGLVERERLLGREARGVLFENGGIALADLSDFLYLLMF